jgi:hypothetical protein
MRDIATSTITVRMPWKSAGAALRMDETMFQRDNRLENQISKNFLFVLFSVIFHNTKLLRAVSQRE